MSELQHILTHYFAQPSTKINYTEGVYSKTVLDFFNNTFGAGRPQAFDRPDVVSILDGRAIGIEHFEFDSFGKNRQNGSLYRKESHDLHDWIDEENYKKLLDGASTAITKGIINSVSSFDDYKNNFLKIFISHAQKIDAYKDNILERFKKKAEIWFFIEDISPFGSSYMNRDKRFSTEWLGLHPFMLGKFVDLLESTKNLGGVIFADSYSQTMQVIFNRSGVIKNLRKNIIDIRDEDFVNFTPNIVGSAMKVPIDNAVAQLK
jgi:hypothetical protein